MPWEWELMTQLEMGMGGIPMIISISEVFPVWCVTRRPSTYTTQWATSSVALHQYETHARIVLQPQQLSALCRLVVARSPPQRCCLQLRRSFRTTDWESYQQACYRSSAQAISSRHLDALVSHQYSHLPITQEGRETVTTAQCSACC